MERITNNFSDVTDSREILESKTPIEFRVLILFFVVTIISLLVAFKFLYVDQYISVSGQVQDKTSTANINISANGGAVESIHVSQGDFVKEGDVLLKIDSAELLLQKQQVDESIKKLEAQLTGLEKLRESVKLDENKLTNSEDEAEFYQQYEQYRMDVITNQNTLNEAQIENNNTIEELEVSINVLSENIQKKKEAMSEITEIINAVLGNYAYNSTDSYYFSLFQSYKISIEEIDSSQENNSSNITTKEKVNNDFLLQLNEKYKTEETALTDLNNEKITKETQLSNLKEKNFYVEDTINKIRQDTLSSIENSITTTQNTLKTEKDKSASLQNDIDVNTITSTKDGIVNILNEINKGDILSGNANVMQLVPRKDKYFIQASIPENEIAKVKEGMAVKCKFNSIPYQEYGKISGKIVQISEAFFQNEEKSTNYYIAEVEIEVENLKNKKGDLLEIKAGMLAEIEIITGNESGLEWILKKINLTD